MCPYCLGITGILSTEYKQCSSEVTDSHRRSCHRQFHLEMVSQGLCSWRQHQSLTPRRGSEAGDNTSHSPQEDNCLHSVSPTKPYCRPYPANGSPDDLRRCLVSVRPLELGFRPYPNPEDLRRHPVSVRPLELGCHRPTGRRTHKKKEELQLSCEQWGS